MRTTSGPRNSRGTERSVDHAPGLQVARQVQPEEQVALTLAIVAINGWNRLAVGFRQPVGDYVSHRHRETAAA